MKLPTYENSHYPQTCEALVAAGIDPTVVSEGGIHELGYFTFVVDENNKRIIRGEEVVFQHNDWPTPEIGRVIYALYLEEHNVRI